MLYMGTNTNAVQPASFDENGKPQVGEQVQKVLDSINLFEEKKQITRQSIHYNAMCSDLSLEEHSDMISFLTGTVKNGMNSLAYMGVSEDNLGFLQESVRGIANSFEQAALIAKNRVMEKAERAQRAQKAQQNNIFNNQFNQSAQPAPMQFVEVVAETAKALETAINQVVNQNFDNNNQQQGFSPMQALTDIAAFTQPEPANNDKVNVEIPDIKQPKANVPEQGPEYVADLPKADIKPVKE